MTKREVKEIVEEKKNDDVIPTEIKEQEKKKRGRPKKEKVEKPKKPIGRPKSETEGGRSLPP